LQVKATFPSSQSPAAIIGIGHEKLPCIKILNKLEFPRREKVIITYNFFLIYILYSALAWQLAQSQAQSNSSIPQPSMYVTKLFISFQLLLSIYKLSFHTLVPLMVVKKPEHCLTLKNRKYKSRFIKKKHI
jgi:hypothetical protein